jgi:hypothetical protein
MAQASPDDKALSVAAGYPKSIDQKFDRRLAGGRIKSFSDKRHGII